MPHLSMPLFRHALRALGRAPGLTVAARVSLGLGIGANTAIFSVTSALLPVVGRPAVLISLRHE